MASKRLLPTEIYQQVMAGNSFFDRFQRRLICLGFGGLCKLFVGTVYDLQIENREQLLELMNNRDPDRGLITVSNHTSTLDEPLLWSMLPFSGLYNIDRMRWTLGAEDVCFANPFTRWFFGSGQGISIRRGAGLKQPGIDNSILKLIESEWVHIFPEGKVFQTGMMTERLKWGVGKCLAAATAFSESKKAPIVLPFYHMGMEKVVPLERFDHSVGYPTVSGPTIRIRVRIGEPYYADQLISEYITNKLEDCTYSSRLQMFREDTPEEKSLYSTLTAEIADRLRLIEQQMFQSNSSTLAN